MQSLHGLVLQADYDALARHRALAVKREAAIRSALGHFSGRHRSRFRLLLRRARRFYPYREKAMFHMGKTWTVLRPIARELGQRLVDAGTLAAADDIYFLTTEEVARALRALKVGQGMPAYRQLALDRRALREARRRLTPPLEVGGPPPWATRQSQEERQGEERNEAILQGSAVSPGEVTAEASSYSRCRISPRCAPEPS